MHIYYVKLKDRRDGYKHVVVFKERAWKDKEMGTFRIYNEGVMARIAADDFIIELIAEDRQRAIIMKQYKDAHGIQT